MTKKEQAGAQDLKKNFEKPEVVEVKDVPTFAKSVLIGQAKQLFNKPPEVIAGALYDVMEPITIEQAQAKVKEFLTRPISTEGGK